jgi:hypothetical protein
VVEATRRTVLPLGADAVIAAQVHCEMLKPPFDCCSQPEPDELSVPAPPQRKVPSARTQRKIIRIRMARVYADYRPPKGWRQRWAGPDIADLAPCYWRSVVGGFVSPNQIALRQVARPPSLPSIARS